MNSGTGLAVSVAVCLGMTATTGADDGLLAPDRLKLINVEAETVEYRGKTALRVREAPGAAIEADTLAVIPGSKLAGGTIEVDLAGGPRAGAFEGARGFVGIACPRAAVARARATVARFSGRKCDRRFHLVHGV